MFAKVATAAGDGKRHHDPVAHCQILDRLAYCDHLAHELMAENVALLHGWNVAVVEVEVGAADRGQADLYDRVAVVDYGRIGNAVDAHVLAAVPAHRFHELSLRVCFGWGSAAAASVTQAAVGRRSRWPGTLCRRYLAGFHQL